MPEFLKHALKKIKSLFNIQTEQNAEHADKTEKANETPGDRGEEPGNRQVWNRRYKIKKILAQPKNFEVK